MRKLLNFILIIFAFTSLQANSSELISFSIDKTTYESLSSSQKENIYTKIAELNEFFNQEVYPQIPDYIINKIMGLKLNINFNDKSEHNGLFIPDEINRNHKILIQLIQLNSNGLKALLAHEFFHAVHFELNPNESPWIREGLAQVFEFMVTNELNGGNLRSAISNPLTPLIGTYHLETPNAAQYGHNMLYFYYLYKHCGEASVFWDITLGQNGLKDTDLLNAVLKKQQSNKSQCRNFASSAVNFEIAKIHNQIQFAQEENQEEFFLAPTNLTPKSIHPKSQNELTAFISEMPPFSSVSLKQEIWNTFNRQCKNCIVVYARNTFPYEITVFPDKSHSKNIDVIIVKIPSNLVLTDVSLKNTKK